MSSVSSDALGIRWATAFLDFPDAIVAAGEAFWQAVTTSHLSARRGSRQQFATLLPADGDAYLRVQRVGDRSPRTHLDLHTSDRERFAARAVDLGATLTQGFDDVIVLHSPGGFPFCSVRWDGERTRPVPAGRPGRRSLVDQLCLDIPPERHAAEVAFWTAITGWDSRHGGTPEFSRLNPPPGIPVQFLLQRLDDPAQAVTAHLDLGTDDAEHEASRHQALGASVVRRTDGWITLADPAGLTYCVTRRKPGAH